MERQDLIKELHVTGPVLVAGDFHIPQHSEAMLELLTRCADESGIRQLVINGDFLNEDAFASFDRKQSNASWDIEVPAASAVGTELAKHFDRIYLNMGNHCKRLLKLTKYSLTYWHVLKMIMPPEVLDKMRVTERDYIIINDIWRACHSCEYAKTPGFKAGQIGRKYKQKVILGHSHMLSRTMEISDELDYDFIDGGCMLDNAKVEYEIMNTTSFTRWTPGFVEIGEDYAEIYSPVKPLFSDRRIKIQGKKRYEYIKERW